MRINKVYRKTRETEIKIKVNLDSKGKANIQSGISFLDHLITSLATHSLIDIEAEVKGDLKHHLVEDLAICLGEAIKKALGTREGIIRFGNSFTPMDDTLAFSAVDLVKRPYSVINLKLKGKKIEDMQIEDINHFFESFATSLNANIHMFVHYGSNDHHKVEAAVKALALSLKQAVGLDPRRTGVPSSKGVI